MKNENKNSRHKPKHKKRLRRFLLTFLVLFLAWYGCASYLLFSFAFEKENFITRHSKGAVNTAVYSGEESTEKENWLTGSGENRYLKSSDGLKLHAYFVKNNTSNRYAIICHGYTSRASHMTRYAKNFFDMGFSVLVPDARAHGESEGNVVGMGYPERKDILLWIDEILKEDGNAKIVLYGVSMGAATVMMAVGESALPKNVVCAVEDCGYTSVFGEVSHQVTRRTNLPFSLLAEGVSIVSKIKNGYSFKQASPLKAVQKSKIPILFIHGEKDKFVPTAMLNELYNAADCPKEKLIIQNAGHAKSSSTDPELYWSAVKIFVTTYINVIDIE